MVSYLRYARSNHPIGAFRIGAAALEMALVAPIILLISFASIENVDDQAGFNQRRQRGMPDRVIGNDSIGFRR